MTKLKSVLLIDDDLMVRQALGQALEVEHYHVVSAANRHEAVREVEQCQIDIVLLDLNPRCENGWDTLQDLTVLRPHLPIVAMTARMELHQPRSNTHRVHVLLEKPLNLSVLLQTLKELAQQTPNQKRHCHGH